MKASLSYYSLRKSWLCYSPLMMCDFTWIHCLSLWTVMCFQHSLEGYEEIHSPIDPKIVLEVLISWEDDS